MLKIHLELSREARVSGGGEDAPLWRGVGGVHGGQLTGVRPGDSLRTMRPAILVMAFLPFLYFAAKDNVYHFKGRSVSRAEHALHACIGLLLAIMFANALRAEYGFVLAALLLFVVAGAVDEYWFHRGIPAEESDLHAKEHLALLIFLILSLATDRLESNGWDLAKSFGQILTAGGGS